MTPKEDPKVKQARERERRLAETESREAGMETTAQMTDTLRRAYGRRYSLFGLR